MMLTTLMLMAGLVAAFEPQAEPQKGWTVEIHGFTYLPKQEPPKRDGWMILEGDDTYLPKQPEPPKGKGWTIEVGGHTYHLKQPERRKQFIIEFQWKPQPEPVEGQYQPVEAQYHDDLSAFFKQLKMQKQGEAVEAIYVDDLPAF